MVLLKMILYPILFFVLCQQQTINQIRRLAIRFNINLPYGGQEVLIALIVLAVYLIESQVKNTQIIVQEGFANLQGSLKKMNDVLKDAVINTPDELSSVMTSFGNIFISDGNEDEKIQGEKLLQLSNWLKQNPSEVEDIGEIILGRSEPSVVNEQLRSIAQKFTMSQQIVEKEDIRAVFKGLVNFVNTKIQVDQQ